MPLGPSVADEPAGPPEDAPALDCSKASSASRADVPAESKIKLEPPSNGERSGSCVEAPDPLMPRLPFNSANMASCAVLPAAFAPVAEPMPEAFNRASRASCAVLPPLADVLVASVEPSPPPTAGAGEVFWNEGSSSASSASSAVVPLGEGGCSACANCCSLTLPVLLGSSWA